MRARFSRPAYYQLAQFIRYNEETERFHLTFDGQCVELDIAKEE